MKRKERATQALECIAMAVQLLVEANQRDGEIPVKRRHRKTAPEEKPMVAGGDA